jgi:hypothetical protein
MRPGALACTLVAALLVSVRALSAQPVRGIGDDATTPQRGVIRVQVSTSITDFTERYGKNTPGRAAGSLEPLGIDFSVDTLGVTQFPGLSAAQTALRVLTGNNAFTLSLGKTALIEQVRVQTTPIQFEAGITSRLSIGVMVPLVSARNQVQFNMNSGTATGNVSFNPASGSDSASSTAANSLLVTQIEAARTQLAALLASCQSNAGSNAQCASIIANAPTINASAGAFTAGVTQVYGVTARGGSPFVPHAASAADSAIRTRVSTFRTQYSQYGVTAIAATTLGPARAASAITPDGMQRASADSTLGLLAAPLGTITHQGLGDVEVAVKLRLFDSFAGKGDTAHFLPTGMNLRQSFAGVYRFGTSTMDLPANYLDIGTGSGKGQNDVEVRSFTDVVYGRHFFGSLIARYTVQLPDQQVMRITDTPEQVFAPAWRQRTVDRNLGDQLQIEVTPRWVLNDFFSVGGQYLFRQKAEDKFTGTFVVPPSETGLAAPVTLNASTLGFETQATEQRIGFGLTFSSVAAHARHQAKFPIEVQYFNSRTIAGSGGNVAKLSIHQLQFRLYPRF